jgi:dTDP-4-dehydrorhamnose reductase
MVKSIFVTGSNGQLGRELNELSKAYPYKFVFTNKQDLDITDENQLFDFFSNQKFDIIINCSAYTAVDKAESEIENAHRVNVDGVKNLVKISNQYNSTLVHISTDFVYDGKSSTPYVETDQTNPLSVYGKTKLEGEYELIKNCHDFIIIRTSWLYSAYGNNFVKTILRLSKERESLNIIFDQAGTPTYACDLAKAILDILPKIAKTNSIFHFSNEGVASWYDFAQEIVHLSKGKCKVYPITTSEYPTPAARPAYSVMNKNKIKQTFNIEIPYWRRSLKLCLEKLEI